MDIKLIKKQANSSYILPIQVNSDEKDDYIIDDEQFIAESDYDDNNDDDDQCSDDDETDFEIEQNFKLLINNKEKVKF